MKIVDASNFFGTTYIYKRFFTFTFKGQKTSKIYLFTRRRVILPYLWNSRVSNYLALRKNNMLD